MVAFFSSFLLVVLAEMGDKTQLLAMAFGAKYKPSLVLWGVFLATLLNHSLAVAAGRLLASFIPLEVITFCASVSFIYFGIWTLKGDRIKEKDGKEKPVWPLVAIFVAFFIAEMGDKTQLATVSLAAKYPSIAGVLSGSVLGMVTADAIGIMGGNILRKVVPAGAIRWLAACSFIFFGFISLHQSIVKKFTPFQVHAVITILAILTFFAALHYRAADDEK